MHVHGIANVCTEMIKTYFATTKQLYATNYTMKQYMNSVTSSMWISSDTYLLLTKGDKTVKTCKFSDINHILIEQYIV